MIRENPISWVLVIAKGSVFLLGGVDREQEETETKVTVKEH